MPDAFIAHEAAAIGLLALACACLGYALARVVPVPQPRLGMRGRARGIALTAHVGFRAIEPATRWLAALIARLPLARIRAWLEQALVEAGDPLGLDADECLALSCLSAGFVATVAHATGGSLGMDPRWTLLLGACGLAAPIARVRSMAARRMRKLARELPAAIDLIALCMGAGLDFAASLALLSTRPSDARSPLADEFGRVLSELALGRTRGEALAALAARAPIEAVRDFTSAVIQAEQKGNPLQDAIAIQARVLRVRRSVLAEEAAARASVLLAFPLLLLLASLLLLMLGPFLIDGVDL